MGNMTFCSRIYFILFIYCLNYIYALSDEYILDEDRPYEDLQISVPHVIWENALNPAPVLKSPVTIVVPVYVPPEDNIDDDYIANEPENEVGIETVEDQVVEVANDTVVESVTPNPVAPTSGVQGDQGDQGVEGITSPAPTRPVNGSLIRFPCRCAGGQCGCCTGAFLQRFQTKACGNITFIPEDFIFDVKLSVNDRTVVRRRVSASDPPPICFNPRRAPFVTVCAEISNIRIRNRNAFACLDINADIGGFPVYSASFRCFGLGASGVQSGLKPKPVSSGPAPVSLFGNGDNDDDDDDGIFGGAADVLGGGGLFGGGSDDDGGPLDAIGDAVGDFFEGRNMN